MCHAAARPAVLTGPREDLSPIVVDLPRAELRERRVHNVRTVTGTIEPVGHHMGGAPVAVRHVLSHRRPGVPFTRYALAQPRAVRTLVAHVSLSRHVLTM